MFPVIIVLVPVQLKVMNQCWARETLKRVFPFHSLPVAVPTLKGGEDVDSWACRPGESLDGEEEEEKGLKREDVVHRGGGWEGMAEEGRGTSSALHLGEKRI